MYKLDNNVARDLQENFAFAHKGAASLNEYREVINKYKEKYTQNT